MQQVEVPCVDLISILMDISSIVATPWLLSSLGMQRVFPFVEYNSQPHGNQPNVYRTILYLS